MRILSRASLEIRSVSRLGGLESTPARYRNIVVFARREHKTNIRFSTSAAATQLNSGSKRRNNNATAITSPKPYSKPTNQALSFPCLDAVEHRTSQLSGKSYNATSSNTSNTTTSSTGPEPSYTSGKHQTFKSTEPLLLDWGGTLPAYEIAYETWGHLNSSHTNAILLHTGLSASSHAHSTPSNPKPGWWEKFIGPGKPLDTDRYFVICTNVLGGCYGSTGPSSIDPTSGEHYGTRFPILTLHDMVRAQFQLLDHLEIECLYASVGSSMGGMQSLTAGVMYPERLKKLVTISSCARSHPSSIAMRHVQRQVLMTDPNWQRGFYYTNVPPHAGMKLARELATITYRSGPEWEQRFGRRRAEPTLPPALCPDFLVETYLDHAGEKWCLEYDANSLLYISKAMDLFDLGYEQRMRVENLRKANRWKLDVLVEDERKEESGYADRSDSSSSSSSSSSSTNENNANTNININLDSDNDGANSNSNSNDPADNIRSISPNSTTTTTTKTAQDLTQDLTTGLAPLSSTPTLVLGVASDILFPAWQQREIADTLRRTGNSNVTHIELGQDKSVYGHDTFLLDIEGVGGSIAGFLG